MVGVFLLGRHESDGSGRNGRLTSHLISRRHSEAKLGVANDLEPIALIAAGKGRVIAEQG